MIAIPTVAAAQYLLRAYSQIPEADIRAAAIRRWPAADPAFATQYDMDVYCDTQLKANLLGIYLMNALTDTAKRELRSFKDEYEFRCNGEVFIDGPYFFWFLSKRVDPDNGQLVSETKDQIRALHIKNFGYSAISLMAEFKILATQIGDLGGEYHDDEMFHDFWRSLLTMHEAEFKRFVKSERDTWWKMPKNNRTNLTNLIKTFTDKETSMSAEQEWNKMSLQDAQVMALLTHVEKLEEAYSTTTQTNPSESGKSDNKRKRDTYPKWKLNAPEDDKATTITREDKTYHWCTKCRNGQGLWALHKTEEHKENFTKKQKKSDESESSTTKAENVKAAVAKTPKVTVNKKLLESTKAYLAQFSDTNFG